MTAKTARIWSIDFTCRQFFPTTRIKYLTNPQLRRLYTSVSASCDEIPQTQLQFAMLKSFVPRASRLLLRPVSSSTYAPSAFYFVPRRGFASEAEEHDVVVIGMHTPMLETKNGRANR